MLMMLHFVPKFEFFSGWISLKHRLYYNINTKTNFLQVKKTKNETNERYIFINELRNKKTLVAQSNSSNY